MTDYTTPWEELVAAGRCDCGRLLHLHPPLPRPKPMGWSGRITVAAQGGRRPMAQQPTLFRTRGRRFTIKAHHQQGGSRRA